MSETKIRKSQVIPWLDTSGTVSSDTWTPTWKRINKSTIFDLAFNPQSEDLDYISMDVPVTEVSRYQPELPQEVKCYRGDPIYDFIETKCRTLPVGNDLQVPFLLAWPPAPGTGSTSVINGWQVKEAIILINNYNSVDGKISFTIKLGGDITQGTISIDSTTGAPTFTAAT